MRVTNELHSKVSSAVRNKYDALIKAAEEKQRAENEAKMAEALPTVKAMHDVNPELFPKIVGITPINGKLCEEGDFKQLAWRTLPGRRYDDPKTEVELLYKEQHAAETDIMVKLQYSKDVTDIQKIFAEAGLTF